MIASFPELVPVLSLPNRAPMLMDMLKNLSERILIFGKDGLQSIATAESDTTVSPPVHAVVEYGAGLKFMANNKEEETKRANRFIFTYDETNSNLEVDKSFLDQFEKIVDKHWVFLLSGYHLLTESVITE